MKAKRIFLFSVLAASVLLSGCGLKIANMTPTTVPTNPSGIYTLSARVDLQNKAIDPASVVAYVVVDGEQHKMQRSDLGGGYYDFDYDIPKDQKGARFYYLVNYRLKKPGDTRGELREVTSPVQKIRLTDRYSISLDANRAPIGTRLAVLGRGFGRSDTVYVGGVEARTEFVSQNALQFTVPALDPGSDYAVEIQGGGKVETAGLLRVDPAVRTPLSVVPERLELRRGERQALAFALDYTAPSGGLYLNVTTDIPESIVMSEVIIPAGARTVNVSVEAAEPGKGSLFINAEGIDEIEVPVTVR